MRRVVTIPSAQSVLIDAYQGETFVIRLITSIRTLQIKNVSPGQLYVFIVTQDQIGGHTIAWGTQVLNAFMVDPAPHSITTQCCIGTTGGILQANAPGAWNG